MAYSRIDITEIAKRLAGPGNPIAPTPAQSSGRLIVRGGRVVDPRNQVDSVMDLALHGGFISDIAPEIRPERRDRVINAKSCIVIPGLIDMHLHLHDLFEVSTAPIFEAVSDGVTVGLTPGAGNSFMAPALLGAEVDRGLPLNVGVYTGIPAALATEATKDELIQLFRGELPHDIGLQKITRNPITLLTAPFTVGLKDHMGHFVLRDSYINLTYEITSEVGMVLLSHTQDPDHAERMVRFSQGRAVQLTHATAAGCGTHGAPREAMQRIVDLVRQHPHVTADFVTSMLRHSAGRREGLVMDTAAQDVAYGALSDGTVRLLISDGQSDATMKGFGSTRDNIPALFELQDMGVLSFSDAVAAMTSNVADHLAVHTKQPWWRDELGHLGVGARGNVAVVNPNSRAATVVVVNGVVAALEGRTVRAGNSAGGYVSRFGWLAQTGVGDLPLYD